MVLYALKLMFLWGTEVVVVIWISLEQIDTKRKVRNNSMLNLLVISKKSCPQKPEIFAYSHFSKHVGINRSSIKNDRKEDL